MNRKGFMMAEVIIVSSIVLVVLLSLFTSYSKIFKIYNERMTYNDVTVLYRLAYIRDSMIDAKSELNDLNFNPNIVWVLNNTKSASNSFLDLKNSKFLNNDQNNIIENVFMVYVANNNLNNVKKINELEIHQTFKDYIIYLSTSAKINSEFLMIMEIYEKNDENNCRYAYLEVYG